MSSDIFINNLLGWAEIACGLIARGGNLRRLPGPWTLIMWRVVHDAAARLAGLLARRGQAWAALSIAAAQRPPVRGSPTRSGPIWLQT